MYTSFGDCEFYYLVYNSFMVLGKIVNKNRTLRTINIAGLNIDL